MVVAILPISPYVSIYSCAIVCTKSGGGGEGKGWKNCALSPNITMFYATNLAQRLNLLLEPKESQNWVCQTHVKFAETLRCVYKETIIDTHTLTGFFIKPLLEKSIHLNYID